MDKIRVEYDLSDFDEGIRFKADFNSFERIKKLLDIRKDKSYIKLDIVRDREGNIYLSRRIANFSQQIAILELERYRQLWE